MRLGSKLVVQTVLPAVVAIAALLAIVTQGTGSALQEAVESSLAAVVDARREELRRHLLRMQDDIVTMASAPAVVQALGEFSAAYSACGDAADTQLRQLYEVGVAETTLASGTGQQRVPVNACRSGYEQAHATNDAFFRKRHGSYGWDDMLLVDLKGNVIYSVHKANDFATNLFSGPWKDTGLARAAAIVLKKGVSGAPAFADAAPYAPTGNSPGMFLAIPVVEAGSGRPLGALAARIAFEPLDQRMHFKSGLGETGEAFLVGTDGWMLTNSFFGKEISVLKRQLKTEAVKRVLAGEEGKDQLVDYRGQESFIAYRPLRPFVGALGDQPQWGVIAKISRDESLASLYSLQRLMLASGLLIAIAAIAFGVVSSRRLFDPVRALQHALMRLAKGEKTPIPGLDRRDEIGDMAKAADTFREMSDAVARDRWIRQHVAALTTEISQATRIAKVPDIILNLLRQRLDVPVATMFLRDTDGNYQRVGAQGLARRSQSQDLFAPGESLIGQCARDAQPLILSPVPSGLVLIATGLAEFPPEELVLYPITHHQETLGVIELASTRKLSPDEHAFLTALIEPLGLHIANIDAIERNLSLLDESRKQGEILGQQKAELGQQNAEMQAMADEMQVQSEELKAQNEEFRANQEELRAQQEELEHKNQALAAQGQQLESSRAQAEARAQELATSNQYKSQFLANMSHELRTPLNSILILAKHLSENAARHLDKDEVESATVIHESGDQLLSLINDILDLSRIEAGKLEMVAEDFPVSDMLTYLKRLFEPLAGKKSVSFHVDSGAIDPGVIRSDRRHLIQVLTNLLSNAVKFTDKGSVQLVVQAGKDALRFDVIDTGIGIAADKLEHIFGAFQQVDSGTARKYGGSGLGLAISRQLVKLLGGRIEIESTPGSGSRFSVNLPRAANFGTVPALAETSAVSAAPAETRIKSTAKTHLGTLILVVEDDTRMLPIVTRLIEALGYSVKVAETGEKALALIGVEPPAGILLDLGLPGISGMEVLRRIKADPATASIPVYIMSAADDTGEAQTLGATGYIRKPITRDAVLTAIRHMVDTDARATPAKAATGVPKLLLVEDDEASSLAVRVLFKDTNIDIALARDGSEGLAAIKSGDFDAVILDLTLPDMTGFEWLEQVARETPPHPPVVVYSARDLDDAALLRLRAHAYAVVSKGRLEGQTSDRLREEVLLALAARQRDTSAALSIPPPTKFVRRHGALLIVDDDVRNQSALSKVLRARGFDVSVAGSGAQALTLLETARYDAILTDIMMPEMDGFEFIRRLRSGTSGDMPIIAVTAKAMPGDIELCLSAGASDYLAKPIDIDRLLALLDKWL